MSFSKPSRASTFAFGKYRCLVLLSLGVSAATGGCGGTDTDADESAESQSGGGTGGSTGTDATGGANDMPSGGTNAGGSGGDANSTGGTSDTSDGGAPAGGAGGGSGGTGGMASGGESAGGSGGMEDPGPQLPKRVLLYHLSPIDDVDAQMDLLEQKLTAWGFESDRTDDPAMINSDNLESYGGVAMMNNCFDAFGEDGTAQAAAMKEFVEAGGGVWGNHCASVTYQSADPPHPWNQLLGGRGGDGFFEGESACRKMGDHPTVADLPAEFDYNGNLDNTDYLADDITILVRCTWGGNGNRDVVVSWTREPGEGRIFFSNFAKFESDLTDPVLSDNHLWPGLAWSLRVQP